MSSRRTSFSSKPLIRFNTSDNILPISVWGLSREVNYVNKRLDDVEESSKFVGAKFDQINKETVMVKSDKKKMTLTNSTQNKLLQERINADKIIIK
jgi:hypothetical protein